MKCLPMYVGIFFPEKIFLKIVFCDKHIFFIDIQFSIFTPPIPFFLCKYCSKLGIGGREGGMETIKRHDRSASLNSKIKIPRARAFAGKEKEPSDLDIIGQGRGEKTCVFEYVCGGIQTGLFSPHFCAYECPKFYGQFTRHRPLSLFSACNTPPPFLSPLPFWVSNSYFRLSLCSLFLSFIRQ